ncbi:MAG: O-antigen ligase family protein [Hydrogenophaga sp.]
MVDEGPSDGALLMGLWLQLAWAPLPLASNRWPLLWLLMAGTGLLLLLALWQWRRHLPLAGQRLWQVRLPLGLLAALVLWQWLQTVPLPPPVLRALSPQAWAAHAAAAQALGQPLQAATLSVEPAITRVQAAWSLCLWTVFALVVLVLRNRHRLDRLAFWLVVAALLQALLALLLWSAQARYTLLYTELTHHVAQGSFVNRNHLAGYLVLNLSLGIGLMLARLGRDGPPHGHGWQARLQAVLRFALSDKMRLRLMLVVMVMALVMTRSRMGNSAFFAALLVTGVLALLVTRRSAPQMVALIASLVVIDVVVVGTWVGLEQVVQRVQETELLIEQGGTQESVEARQLAARYALDLVRDFAWTGSGAGTFYGAYWPYRVPGGSMIDHAHNDYVELAADLGLPGLALLGALVLATAWVCIITLARRHTAVPRGMAFGVLMAMVALAIHSTVDFNLQIPANALLAVVWLAIGWSAWALPSGARDRHRASSGP